MSIDSKFKAAAASIKRKEGNARNISDDAIEVTTEERPKKLEWDRTTVEFSNVAPSSVQSFSFKYLGDKEISSIVPACGCTSVKNTDNTITGTLIVPADFSYAQERIVSLSKGVTVTLTDKQTGETNQETLTIKCKVDKWL